MQFATAYLTEDDWKALTDRLEKVVDAAFERHGFKQPHSATSVTHNIMAENTERDRHAARMLALSKLLLAAKDLTKDAHNNVLDHHTVSRVEIAIAAVEREFKP